MNILQHLSKEELQELITLYSKNWLALDGVWFQSIEQTNGMDAAMYHDEKAWERFTVIEAKRIKSFLKLEEHPGLEGLEQALSLRFYAHINKATFEYKDNKLIYTMKQCRVQTARERKGMPWHPCKPVGIKEYTGFARTIDDRITCRCLSCYPDVNDTSCCCKWEFSLCPPSKDEPVLHRKMFQELTTGELYELLRIRSEIFVVEQNCVYQDLDGDDQASIHIWLTVKDKVVALARVCPAGTHMQQISIGRVITTVRGKGYGRQIMLDAIKTAKEYFHATSIDIEAQEYAKGFYENIGFRKSSDSFILDDIPHIKMTWTKA